MAAYPNKLEAEYVHWCTERDRERAGRPVPLGILIMADGDDVRIFSCTSVTVTMQRCK